MNNIAKYHHIVPVLLLRGFTSSGSEDGSLWVHNLDTKRPWESAPRRTGGQKYYNTIEVPGVRPDALEQDLSREFEGPAAKVISDIIASQSLPVGDDFWILMRFIALMSNRVEGVRQASAEADVMLIKQRLNLYAENAPERVPEEIKKLRDKGVVIPEQINADTLTSIDFDDYEIKLPQNWIVSNFLDYVKIIDWTALLFAERKWSLYVAQDSSDEIICCDQPVVLVWTIPIPYSRNSPPGFGLLNTELTMPLNRRMALVANFPGCEGKVFSTEQTVKMANRRTVAIINRRTLDQAYREIYSAHKDFIWLRNDFTVCDRADLEAIRQDQRTDALWGCAK